ncbi:uncharacterized protein LOC116303516 [Actinia tenebrosa]|uniref:Uncharacterized protein LOC116303516 n=1 Tax=Actinia tenebrosa TaxID=6105 RepID=A0A6P8IPG4_ACTTE|nr:uncharacterized protein LOC116303516 [Actinia tenebrosa]
MEENAIKDEEPPKTSKAWLLHTDKSLSRLHNVKKTFYRLGGGPKEREVDCQCNYRSKHSSSFVNMDPDPPKISQESQETASNIEMSVPELVRHQNDKKPKQRYTQARHRPKQKKIPYSAIVCCAEDTPEVPTQEKQQQGHPVKNFIAIKGQNVSPQLRQSSSSQSASQQIYKGACLLHLDPHLVEETQKATLEGLRKYSAYGQDDTDASALPKPPRGSPEVPGSPIDFSPPKDEHLLQDGSLEYEFYDYSDEEEDEDLKAVCQSGEMSSLSSTGSKSFVFQIPTADIEYGTDDEESFRNTPLNASSNDRALSADYVEKSGIFLDELAAKQKEETEELSEMFSEMFNDKVKVDNIDLRSVLSTPNTAQQATHREENTGLSVVNIGIDNVLEDQHLDGGVSEDMWVEEPYVPRTRNEVMERNLHLGLERFQSPKRRVQSAKTTRRKEEDGFVLKGKTFEFFDVRDLAVNRRLSEQRNAFSSAEPGNENICSGKANEVIGKPPRPKSAKKPKVQKRHSNVILNSREGLQEGNEPSKHDQKIPRRPLSRNPKKSSLRKSFSQGDVRCLSPEVIASVKKTVSFSDEVLEKPTQLLIQGKFQNKNLENPEIPNPEDPILDISKAEVPKPEIDAQEAKMPPDEEKTSSQNNKNSKLLNSFGVIIQNGLEVKEPVMEIPDTPPKERPSKGGPAKETNSNVIAQIKEVTRCSCHVEGCHCRDITRPTKAVMSQAKAAKEQGGNCTPHGKLLKQRPSRPSSAPIKREVPLSTQTVPTPPRSRITSAQHNRSGSEGSRRVRPVSAHIKRPSAKENRRVRERIHAPIPPDPRVKRKKENKKDQSEHKDMGFVWGPGEDDVAASEECEEVYAKFKEKGINISMQTVKRGLMAPARRASENCMASFSMSSSSGLLSRPETWLPEEYARVKIWDDVLKKGR